MRHFIIALIFLVTAPPLAAEPFQAKKTIVPRSPLNSAGMPLFEVTQKTVTKWTCPKCYNSASKLLKRHKSGPQKKGGCNKMDTPLGKAA